MVCSYKGVPCLLLFWLLLAEGQVCNQSQRLRAMAVLLLVGFTFGNESVSAECCCQLINI